jgi:hypothetical protein
MWQCSSLQPVLSLLSLLLSGIGFQCCRSLNFHVLTGSSCSSHCYRSCSSSYSLGMDSTENTSPNCSSIVASHSYRQHSFPLTQLLHVANLLQPLPSNDRCLQSQLLTTAVVQLLISWSLHRNGSTCRNNMGMCCVWTTLGFLQELGQQDRRIMGERCTQEITKRIRSGYEKRQQVLCDNHRSVVMPKENDEEAILIYFLPCNYF